MLFIKKLFVGILDYQEIYTNWIPFYGGVIWEI